MKIYSLITLLLLSATLKAAPENVRVLSGSLSNNGAIIYWDKPSDYKSVTGYDVYLDGAKLGSTTKNNYVINTLSPAQSYTLYVASTGGTTSPNSTPIFFTTKPSPTVVNVADYGAKGDNSTLNTVLIQKAIDECPQYGVVYIPPGTYKTGAIFIRKSDISIQIATGATLISSAQLEDFPIVKSRYEGLHKDVYSSVLNIGERDGARYSNIRIFGGGTIDNQGSIFAAQQTAARDRMARSHGLPIISCDNVCIDGITIQNPCTWNVHPIYCNGFTTNNCKLISADYGISNGDGWDPDSSSDCYLINSELNGQDDNVAIKSGRDAEGRTIGIPSTNIYVSNCHFIKGGGLAIGSEQSGGVQEVIFEDLQIDRCDRGFNIKAPPGRGGYITDIIFRDIVVDRASGWGMHIDSIYGSTSTTTQNIPEFSDILFENILIKTLTASSSSNPENVGHPIQIRGRGDKPVKNITFRNYVVESSPTNAVVLKSCQNVTFENVKVGKDNW